VKRSDDFDYMSPEQLDARLGRRQLEGSKFGTYLILAIAAVFAGVALFGLLNGPWVIW
jgi:hypothetical protein